MAFTDEEIAYLQTRLGSGVNEDTNPTLVEDLETRYARLGTVQLVAVEVLRIRIANIADPEGHPLQYSISGEYSQDGSKNLDFLMRMLRAAEQEAGVEGASILSVAAPAYSRWGR